VRIGPLHADLDLCGGKAELASPFDLPHKTPALLEQRLAIRNQARVRGNEFLPRTSQEFPDGLSLCLTIDVPDGHIQRADGADACPAPPRHGSVSIKEIPNRTGLGGVLADQQLRHSTVHDVRTRRFDQSLNGPGSGIHFPYSGNAFLRMDLDDDGVLRRVTGIRIQVGGIKHGTINRCDLYGSVPSFARVARLRRATAARRVAGGVDVPLASRGSGRAVSLPQSTNSQLTYHTCTLCVNSLDQDPLVDQSHSGKPVAVHIQADLPISDG
jgi:hypothetical protein